MSHEQYGHRAHAAASTTYAKLRDRDPDLYRAAVEQAGATSLALGLTLEQSAGVERALVSFTLRHLTDQEPP